VLLAAKYADHVSVLVNKELEKGYLIGPFIKPPFNIDRVSIKIVGDDLHPKHKRV
jgi:hypothetical protein